MLLSRAPQWLWSGHTAVGWASHVCHIRCHSLRPVCWIWSLVKAKEVKDSPVLHSLHTCLLSHFNEPVSWNSLDAHLDVVPCFENAVEVSQNDG